MEPTSAKNSQNPEDGKEPLPTLQSQSSLIPAPQSIFMDGANQPASPPQPAAEEKLKEERKARKKMVILTDTALQHYETARDMGIEGRSASRLLFLRSFNNWVKSTLIRHYCRKRASVMDLCCGKGGDIHKWKLSDCGHYVGMDISEHAINHAVERFKKYDVRDIFPAIFVKKADVTDPSLDINYIIPRNVQFDIVSCQMSMHYLFNNVESIRNFLNIVTLRLVPGGYFIGTIPDANVLVKKVRATKEKVDAEGKKRVFSFGNGFYSAAFSQKSFPKDKPFGIKYYFYLEDSVGRKEDNRIVYVPEYLVVFEKFKEIAAEYQLELVERHNFHEFYKEQLARNVVARKTFYKMVHMKDTDSEKELKEQWDAVYLYTVFAFKKKGESKSTCGNCGSKEHLKIVNAKGWD